MTLQEWKDELDRMPVPDDITWYEMQGAFVLKWGKKTRKFFIGGTHADDSLSVRCGSGVL